MFVWMKGGLDRFGVERSLPLSSEGLRLESAGVLSLLLRKLWIWEGVLVWRSLCCCFGLEGSELVWLER